MNSNLYNSDSKNNETETKAVDKFTVFLFLSLLTLTFLHMWLPRIYAFGNIEYYLELNNLGISDITKLALPFPNYLKILNPLIYLNAMFTIIYVIGKYKIVKTNYLILYILMIFYMGFLLVFKTTEPFLYLTSLTQASFIMAPGTILVISLFFLSYNPRVWIQISKALIIFLYLIMIFTILGFIGVGYEYYSTGLAHRLVSLRWLWAPSIILELLCILAIANKINKKNWLMFLPIIFLFMGGIFTQTRLTIIMGIINILVFFILTRKIKHSYKIFRNVLVGVFTLFITVIFYLKISSDNFMGAFMSQFISRISEDSRSEQIVNFKLIILENFSKVFPFGSGYPSFNEYRALGANGIDSGYLNILYTTGIPMFILIFLLLLLPVIKALRLNMNFLDAAIVAAAITWMIRLTSSSTMMFTTEFLLFVLFSGRCAWLVNQQKRGD